MSPLSASDTSVGHTLTPPLHPTALTLSSLQDTPTPPLNNTQHPPPLTLSSPHDTASLPSGANSADRTQLRCPEKDPLNRWLGSDHILTVLSSEAVRRKRPSAAKDTERTEPLWAWGRWGGWWG